MKRIGFGFFELKWRVTGLVTKRGISGNYANCFDFDTNFLEEIEIKNRIDADAARK